MLFEKSTVFGIKPGLKKISFFSVLKLCILYEEE